MRILGYVRVSTEEQAAGGYGLDAQASRIQEYARLYALDLVEVISDAGESARSLERPGLRRALACLDAGEADGILVAKLDRLTRSVRDLGNLIERYFGEKPGKRLMAVDDQIDTKSAGGRLVLNVLASVSQWEREVIGERTAAALAEKKRQGEHLGVIPYGFRLDEPGGRLESDEHEQAVVRQVHELRRQGLSLRSIAAVLNAAGEATRRARLWSATQIGRLLERKVDDEEGPPA